MEKTRFEFSTYARISKQVGWKHSKCSIPSIESAKKLLKQIIETNDETAFKTILTIHRFTSSPVNVVETEAMNIIHQAVIIGVNKFR